MAEVTVEITADLFPIFEPYKCFDIWTATIALRKAYPPDQGYNTNWDHGKFSPRTVNAKLSLIFSALLTRPVMRNYNVGALMEWTRRYSRPKTVADDESAG
jgi:hypothetical protein